MLKKLFLKFREKTRQEEVVLSGQEYEDIKSVEQPYSKVYGTGIKALAYTVFVLMSGLFCVSLISIVIMFGGNIYTRSEREVRKDVYESVVHQETAYLLENWKKKDYDSLDSIADQAGIAKLSITKTETGEKVYEYISKKREEDKSESYQWKQRWKVGPEGVYMTGMRSTEEKGVTIVDVSVLMHESILRESSESDIVIGLHILYLLKYWIYIIASLSAVLCLVTFIYLMVASGRRVGERRILPGWGTEVPFDVLTGGVGFVLILCLLTGAHILEPTGDRVFIAIVPSILLYIFCASIGLGWCMSLALRIKLGGWYKNTLIYRFLKWSLKIIGKACGLFVRGIYALPSMWSIVLVVLGISFIEFMFVMSYSYGAIFGWFLLEKIIILPIIFYIVWMLLQLKKGGEILASGKLDYQISEEKLKGDFKEHAHHLNNIAKGMSLAVEEKMKSERMKMELITNVSHDIKTPLTSIINYSDLIGKEHSENETINEYAEVLYRQSKRLKRLIEDLVEASKVSTGNLEIIMAPCQVGVILTQAVGEFEQKMREKSLELISRQPEEEIYIMADGRRIWRVFDNLLNNIYKYAQPNTRVYLSLKKEADRAVISFKNTSRDELNLTADEFLERFTRGDASRNTEGTGLGLSIAKSLTELQKGKLELSIDGDLFKVELRFPVIK